MRTWMLSLVGCGLGCLFLWDLNSGLAAAEPTDPRRPPAIQTENVPVVPQALVDRLRQYQSVRSARFRGWAPDGSGILIQTQFGNTQQLHRVARPGASREQITFLEEPTDGGYLKGSQTNRLLLTYSSGGDENYQISRLDLKTGRQLLLTDGKSRNLLGPASEDGTFFVYASNQRNGRDMDLYQGVPDYGVPDNDAPNQSAAAREILQVTNQTWIPVALSHDGQRLIINRYVSINETYPAVLDLKTLKVTPLPAPPEAPEKFAWGTLAFSADGSAVWGTNDAVGEFLELYHYSFATGAWERVPLDVPWDCDSLTVDPTTGQIAVTHNANGISELRVLSGQQWRKYALPLGIVDGVEFSPDGSQLGFSLGQPNSPTEAWSLALQSGELTRWTTSEVGGLNRDSFVSAQPIHFPSFDGRQIPAYLLKPRNPAGKMPVLINIHGGPEGQYQPFFSGLDQFYAELGIAVIAPNVRGSAGYGKTYLQLDNAARREDSVKDIGALLDWIATQPDLDASRVAVSGGSYGGYMVLASLTHYPERIRAGIDIVGIANFITFLENTSEYRRDLRRAEYGDERDPQMRAVFEKINPTSNVSKIRSALLVAHGRNDPRVPFSEAEQIAPLVRKNGQTVWTVYADNEGHGFAKRVNRDYLTAVMALFLQEHLALQPAR